MLDDVEFFTVVFRFKPPIRRGVKWPPKVDAIATSFMQEYEPGIEVSTIAIGDLGQERDELEERLAKLEAA